MQAIPDSINRLPTCFIVPGGERAAFPAKKHTRYKSIRVAQRSHPPPDTPVRCPMADRGVALQRQSNPKLGSEAKGVPSLEPPDLLTLYRFDGPETGSSSELSTTVDTSQFPQPVIQGFADPLWLSVWNSHSSSNAGWGSSFQGIREYGIGLRAASNRVKPHTNRILLVPEAMFRLLYHEPHS